MPYVQLRTIHGLLGAAQKHYLMEKITDLLVEVEGGGDTGFHQQVWIEIIETEAPNWQVGKLRPTKDDIAGFVRRRGKCGATPP